MLTLVENVYQGRQGLQDFVIFKVAEKILEAFSKLSTKAKSKQWVQLKK